MTPSFGGDATNAGSLNWGKKASSEADEAITSPVAGLAWDSPGINPPEHYNDHAHAHR